MEQEKLIHTEVVDIDDLIQDDHNFNKGTEEGARLIERSFKDYGAGRSVLIDRNNRLVGGNKAQKGFKGAGFRKVVIVDSDPDTLVAVRRKDVDLDSKEGRDMALLDNLTTQVNLAWDEVELQQVGANVEGFDPGDFGFDIGDLPVGDPTEADKVKEDDFDPDEHYEPKTKTGDIFQLGEHRLMCGDSTKAEDVAKLMNGEQAVLWLTDPPYNVAYEGGTGLTIQNDNMESAKFRAFLIDAFKAANSVMVNGCPFYIWFASREHINFEGALNDVGLKVRQELIWNKNALILGRSHYQWKHEPCLYGWKGDSCRYFIDDRTRTTVWSDGEEIEIDKMKKAEMQKLLHDILDNRTPTTVIDCPKPQKSADHPTMKPVRLFGYQMANSSLPGEIVLDTFGGSGTTMVAAEQLGRKARLMELDPHYCNVIIARWEKLTGQKAVKLNQ